MRVDLLTPNYEMRGVTEFRVRRGEEFSLYLWDAAEAVEAFANNDKVLGIDVMDTDVIEGNPSHALGIVATNDGTSRIQFQVAEGLVIMTIVITVFSDEAQSFIVPAPTIS